MPTECCWRDYPRGVGVDPVGAVVDGAVTDGVGTSADAAFARQNRAVYCHDSRWPGMGA